MTPTRRRPSRTLFRHVAREFLLPLTCSLLAFAFLFMVNNVFDDLQDFTAARTPWKDILLYFLALQPHNLANVIPISVLLATSFMTVMLGRNNELCAMRAAGLSLAVCAAPVWITAGLMTAVSAAIAESWGPRTYLYAQKIKAAATGKKNKALKPVAASLRASGRDWFATPEPGGNAFRDVILRQANPDDAPRWIIAAERAEQTGETRWTFTSGTRLDFPGPPGTPPDHTPFQTLTLELPEHAEDITAATSVLDAVSGSQALERLRRSPALPKRTAARFKTIAWYQFTFPLASLVAALFGFAMTITHRRTDAMKGFAGAVGVLVLFYIIGQIFFVAGKYDWLPAPLAGAAPNILFTAAGIIAVIKRQ